MEITTSTPELTFADVSTPGAFEYNFIGCRMFALKINSRDFVHLDTGSDKPTNWTENSLDGLSRKITRIYTRMELS